MADTSCSGAPCTISLMTYNLWKTDGKPTAWESREPVLARQLEVLDPDVLLAQELHPDISKCILRSLPQHLCVEDAFRGWQNEGNIFYRKSLLEEVDHGCVEIGQCEPDRRLFWLRLQCNQTKKRALFATAHFTWQGAEAECKSDVNLRKEQSRRTAEALTALQRPDEPCFFGGDLNESFWPKRHLSNAGFIDCFSALKFPCRATHPTRPSVAHEEANADQALDWLFARPSPASSGKDDESGSSAKRQRTADSCSRPLLASVIRDMCALSSADLGEKHLLAVQPSDHCPVMAVYRY